MLLFQILTSFEIITARYNINISTTFIYQKRPNTLSLAWTRKLDRKCWLREKHFFQAFVVSKIERYRHLATARISIAAKSFHDRKSQH